MKKILIVDDDPADRNHLCHELKAFSEIKVHTAENAKQAARLTETQAFDLIITELDLPKIDGLKLLYHLKKKSPEIPTMAMAHHYTPRMEAGMAHFKVAHCFTKPLDMDLVIDAVLEKLEIPGGGHIHGISLASFLQLVELEQKTCTLVVRSNHEQGRIYCREGNVIAAEAEGETGKSALYRLLFWDNAVIEVEEGCRNSCREIDKPLMYLLMEGHRMRDEFEEEPAPTPPETEEAEPRMAVPDQSEEPEPKDKPGNRKSPPDSDPVKALSSRLNRAPEIAEFGIYDRDDRVRDKRFTSDSLYSLIPSDFFRPGDGLADLIGGGSLDFVDITVHGRFRYAVCRHEEFFIVMGLQPGSRTPNLIRKYKLLK